MDIIANYALELKAIHIISFIAWMAALLYMPRLFVYHAKNIENKEYTDIVKIQENNLYKYIAIPSMIATLISGFLLIMSNPSIMSGAGFMHAKLLIVLILVIFNFSLGHYKNTLADKTCIKSSKFFRIYNEIPTILLIAIVILIVLKPF